MADEKPKHKPSPKRTLEEVLKSLQDLIRNDLVSRRAGDTPTPPPSTPPAASTPDAFDQALDRLDELITHELIEPAKHARDVPQSELEEPVPGEAEWPFDDGETGDEDRFAAPEAEPSPKAPVPPGAEQAARPGEDERRLGIQDTLPFDEPTPSLASFLKDAEPHERLPESRPPEPPEAPIPATPPKGGAVDDHEPTPAPRPLEERPGEPIAPGDASSVPDDGIPVLHEVAEVEAVRELATPEQAREIAIRVVARLNIERRKAGEAPLDIRTIERLQQLLKDALARGEPPTGD